MSFTSLFGSRADVWVNASVFLGEVTLDKGKGRARAFL
jgi:hypothetical protein